MKTASLIKDEVRQPLRIGEKTRQFLERQNMPIGDIFSLPTSTMEFSRGGHFGVELSSVNSAQILRDLIRLAKEFGFSIDRCDECRGIFRLPDKEVSEMIRICADQGIGFIMSVGPRAVYDIGGFVKSTNGQRIGYRLRGMENIVRAVEDVRRAADLGVRGFLIYDEGLLLLLKQLRTAGEIPASCILKLSVHACCANPMAARLFQNLGADTINPVPDLDLPMLSALRAAVSCPLDLFSDTAEEAGGFIRTYDIPEFVRIAAPVYLKCGPISQPKQNHLPSSDELRERAKQTLCVLETLRRYCPQAKQVNAEEPTKAVPEK